MTGLGIVFLIAGIFFGLGTLLLWYSRRRIRKENERKALNRIKNDAISYRRDKESLAAPIPYTSADKLGIPIAYSKAPDRVLETKSEDSSSLLTLGLAAAVLSNESSPPSFSGGGGDSGGAGASGSWDSGSSCSSSSSSSDSGSSSCGSSDSGSY